MTLQQLKYVIAIADVWSEKWNDIRHTDNDTDEDRIRQPHDHHSNITNTTDNS